MFNSVAVSLTTADKSVTDIIWTGSIKDEGSWLVAQTWPGIPVRMRLWGKKAARQLWAQTGYLCWHRVAQVVILKHNWANVRTELKMYTSPKLPHNARLPDPQQWQCNILNAGPLANLWLRRRLGIGAPHTKARSRQWDGTVLGTTMLHRKVRMMPSGMTQAFISTYPKAFGDWTKLLRKIPKC